MQMSGHILVQQHNVASGREHEAFRWFQQDLAPRLFAQGVGSARRYKLLDLQLQPENPQPHAYLSVFDFDPRTSPGALDALSHLAREEPLAAGLLTDDAAHVYEMTRDWVPSPNPADMLAPEYLLLVMANFVVEMEDEYHDWYDNVHGPEVLDTPGFTGLRRGRRAERQAAPVNDYPSNAVVLSTTRTNDIIGSLDEFRARANGESKTGIHWNFRSPSASLARTTHIFAPLTPRLTA